MIAPPSSEPELLDRARDLAGRTLAEVAARADLALPADLKRRKGTVGMLLEQALGATAGSRALPDFPALGVELKTLPVGPNRMPRESTFVCTLCLRKVAEVEFAHSLVRRKLARVLFVPVEADPALPLGERRVGAPFLWSPTPEEEAVLRADWDELVGRIGCGLADLVTGHLGQALQIRPKAAHGGVRTRALDEDGALIEAMPRGFYLRARFTGGLLTRALQK